MAKYGRFGFGKIEPTETYEGDYMALESGYVRIFQGEPAGMNPPRLLAAIHVDRGQSVREIKAGNDGQKPSKKDKPFVFATGRKFR
jgi:hypothetical protein